MATDSGPTVNKTKQNQAPSWKTVFGVTSTFFFWVGDNSKLKAKSGRSLLSQREAGALVSPGEGGRGHRRGGKVWGRRGKGTFAVQLAALCEAGTVGRYRAGEESKREAFSSPLFSSPFSLCSPCPLAPQFSSASVFSSHMFILTELQPGKTYCVGSWRRNRQEADSNCF